MIEDIFISPEIKEATKKGLQADPLAQEIDQLNNEINLKTSEINQLQDKLNRFKMERASLPIKWRSSTLWCLTIDADNFRFFLKSTAGVYKCVAFKNKVDITSDMKNKVAVTLAGLFKEKMIGRISHNGNFYYGLPKFFKDNLTELKDEYKDDLDRLIL